MSLSRLYSALQPYAPLLESIFCSFFANGVSNFSSVSGNLVLCQPFEPVIELAAGFADNYGNDNNVNSVKLSLGIIWALLLSYLCRVQGNSSWGWLWCAYDRSSVHSPGAYFCPEGSSESAVSANLCPEPPVSLRFQSLQCEWSFRMPSSSSASFNFERHLAAILPIANRLNLIQATAPYLDLSTDDPPCCRPDWLLFRMRSWQKIDISKV